jgi:hypothetical protein
MKQARKLASHMYTYTKSEAKGNMLPVITQFWVIPQKSLFFKIKIKKIK